MNLEGLYQYAPVGLCYLDTDLRYVYVNDWLAKINGLTVQQHIGQLIGDILPGVAAGVESELRGVIRTGNPVLRGKAHVETAAHPGSKRHYEHNYLPDASDDGTIVGVISVVQDVTERTEAEGAAVRLNADLEVFGHLLFHDLRGPIVTISNYSSTLPQNIGGDLDQEHRRYLDGIISATKGMAGIVDGLRDLILVGTEGLRQEVDLSLLAREIITELRVLEPDRAVEFGADEGLITEGDPGHMRLLLVNLLGNAWKFTAERDPASIQFGAERGQDDRLVYYVRDNGVGFDSARSEGLFKAFQRLHSAQEFKGTGLGLTTVQRVVRKYDGEVWGEGAEGKGATFRFTLVA